MSSSTTLDHIIILLPYATLLSLPTWLRDNFTITPGGQHADKRTENKLITFTDGVYLELIAFVNDDPVLKKGHHWGDKVLGQGVIDWCQSGQLENAEDTTSFAYSEMVARVDALTETIGSAKISYTAPQQGGRLRPDGEKLEWLVTFPTSTIGETTSTRPAGIPFFCHDVTSRALRLSAETPEKREKYTSHPCGATGVSSLTLLIPQAELSSYVNIVAAVSNSAAVACGISEFRLMLGAADDDTASIEVIVRKPNTEEEEAYLEKFGAGVYSFHAKSTKTARLEGEGIRIYMHP